MLGTEQGAGQITPLQTRCHSGFFSKLVFFFFCNAASAFLRPTNTPLQCSHHSLVWGVYERSDSILTIFYKYLTEDPGVNFHHLIHELFLPWLHPQASAATWRIGLGWWGDFLLLIKLFIFPFSLKWSRKPRQEMLPTSAHCYFNEFALNCAGN